MYMYISGKKAPHREAVLEQVLAYPPPPLQLHAPASLPKTIAM